jgi:hypothetical protein
MAKKESAGIDLEGDTRTMSGWADVTGVIGYADGIE